jgi:hypothetical protein
MGTGKAAWSNVQAQAKHFQDAKHVGKPGIRSLPLFNLQ